jgi:hypothetical protein
MEQEEDDGERAPETPLNDKAEKGKNASEDRGKMSRNSITLHATVVIHLSSS